MNDEQLLEELRRGSESAFENLVYRYHGPIYAYLYRMLNKRQTAEDLTQECFLRVMESIRKGRLPDTLRPWIYRIAANLCKDYWRKSSTRSEVLQDPMERDLPTEASVASIFDKQQEREQVIQAIQQLNEDKRNLIILRFYQELKLEEIAAILEQPLSTIKSRLYQSLAELNRILSRENQGDSQRLIAKGGKA